MSEGPFHLAGVCLSSCGTVRATNEDAVAIDPVRGFAVVADGMGGHRSGEVASQMACTAVVDRLKAIGRPATRTSMRFLKELVAGINREIHAASALPEHRGMGATLALVVTDGARAAWVHVGDSRIYRLRDGQLELLTRDDTLLSDQVAAGLIDVAEVGNSRNRHFVTQALGVASQVTVHGGDEALHEGDLYLLCTDGLNDQVCDDEIALILSSLQTNLPMVAEHLVQLANDCGGYDNVSVALLRVERPAAPATGRWLARLFSWRFRG